MAAFNLENTSQYMNSDRIERSVKIAYETVKRNRFHNPDSGQTANHASRNHREDLHGFHIPLERMHTATSDNCGQSGSPEATEP